jgi:hypothetical protein
MDDATLPTQTEPKRPYRTPELRDLGTIAEVTETTNAGGPGGDASYNTSQ